MDTTTTYSVKNAAVSLFIGLMLAGCMVLAIIVTMSLVGINSLVVYDGIAILGWVGGVAYAGYRAASVKTQAENNAWIIFVLVLMLFTALVATGNTLTESFEPFGTLSQRLIKLGLTLPAAWLGVNIRRKQGNPPQNLWTLIRSKGHSRRR